MSISKKEKAIRFILTINVLSLLVGPVLHGITGQHQPIVSSIGLGISLVTTVIAVIMVRKEKKAAEARRQRLYA